MSRYRRYVLAPPAGPGVTTYQSRQQKPPAGVAAILAERGAHRQVPRAANLLDIEVNIGLLAKTVLDGIEKWKQDLVRDPRFLSKVTQNLAALVREHRVVTPVATGTVVFTFAPKTSTL